MAATGGPVNVETYWTIQALMIPPRGYSVAAVSFLLRSENRETVELFNKTVGVHRDISFQVGGKEWRLTLERSPLPFQPAFEIAITLDGHPLIVGFYGTLPEEWLPPGLAGVDLSALPGGYKRGRPGSDSSTPRRQGVLRRGGN